MAKYRCEIVLEDNAGSHEEAALNCVDYLIQEARTLRMTVTNLETGETEDVDLMEVEDPQ